MLAALIRQAQFPVFAKHLFHKPISGFANPLARLICILPMKKSKKRKVRPSKPKGRPKQKQTPKASGQNMASASAADLYSGGFDFSAPTAPPIEADVVNRARAELRQGNHSEALDLARQALTANPEDADALNIAGVAAFQGGGHQEGLDLLRTSVAFAPGNAEALTHLGNVLAAMDKPVEAESAYKDAISVDPDYADAPFNLGVLLESQERFLEALSAYEQALKNSPTHNNAQVGRGNSLKALKRLDEARSAYVAVLDRNPALPEARTNLAAVLQELGDFEGAAREANRAFAADPDLLEAEFNYAIACQELGRYEDAIEAYKDVLSHAPEHAASALNIGYGLQQLGKLDKAADAFLKTIELDPDFAKAHVNLADLRLQQGKAQAAFDICNAYLENHPGQTDLLAFKAVSLWDLEDETKARELNDFERFVRPVNITPPPQYDGLEAFNDALCKHVLAHPTLTLSPQSHATRKGRHSGELLTEPKGPIAGLETEILRLADAYRQNMSGDDTHPFTAKCPKDWSLSVWGVVMQAAGHQIPHIHPAAWLSGVYYPRLPEIVSASDGSKAGWIEFGRPPDHFHNARDPETLSIQPEQGLMVLFPSYFYHHTVPFEADGTRISIAFDLMPI
jgi:tetratricopeptide (TPR) repeat protein